MRAPREFNGLGPLAAAPSRAFAAPALLACLAALGAMSGLAPAATWAANAEDERPYVSARIVFPAPGEAVRANGGQLTVAARIAPALRPDHRVQLLLDGAATGPPQIAPRFHLTDLHRGAHGLQLRIFDAAGNVLFVGQPSEFHLLRHSRLH